MWVDLVIAVLPLVRLLLILLLWLLLRLPSVFLGQVQPEGALEQQGRGGNDQAEREKERDTGRERG